MKIRLLPQTLFGQIVVLLTVSLIAVQILTISILWTDRAQQILLEQQALAVNRVTNLYKRMQNIPTYRQQQLANKFSSPSFRIRLLEADTGLLVPVDAKDDELQSLIKAIEELLPGATRWSARWISMSNETAQNASVQRRVAVVAALPRGAVEMVFAFPQPPIPPLRMLTALFAGVLFMVLVAVVLVRLLLKPLRKFAMHAKDIGDDVFSAPMSVEGTREVKTAIEAFNIMQQRIVSLMEDRGRMVSAISHDLKTPITRMMLRAEFVEDEETAAKIQRDLGEMEGLINDALAYFRPDYHAEAPQPILVDELLQQLVEEFNVAENKVALVKSSDAVASGQPMLLKRALSNLISNGIKYGSHVACSTDVVGSRVWIRIRDFGPGLSADGLAQAFDPFWRAEQSRSSTTGGHGLGLSICKHILEQQGGTIGLENHPEGGLQVTVTLASAPIH